MVRSLFELGQQVDFLDESIIGLPDHHRQQSKAFEIVSSLLYKKEGISMNT